MEIVSSMRKVGGLFALTGFTILFRPSELVERRRIVKAGIVV
jgi:hypothetical protein